MPGLRKFHTCIVRKQFDGVLPPLSSIGQQYTFQVASHSKASSLLSKIC